jgi:MoxR-like ATPase
MSEASESQAQAPDLSVESAGGDFDHHPLAEDCFSEVGAYGFRSRQTPILAALVTEDPLLLIGQSGTGKTFLLNSISEVLGLEHRHYNASLISFDDLVGFPYPDDARESVRFLETPATIWNAESVLIDEISRCKPEHQNRLFSLVHERCIQGIPLGRLRYRWAAMNPCTADQEGPEDYLGSEPLDPALADRFSVIVEVNDWSDLSTEEQHRVANPAGEGARSDDAGKLARELAGWRKRFQREIEECPSAIVDYACTVVTLLGNAGIRISPRRARLLARTLLAARIVEGRVDEKSFRTVLGCSLPQRAWGETVAKEKIDAVHRAAWDAGFLVGDEKWLHAFHLCKTLKEKTELLIEYCPSPDAGTLAVEQLIASESKERAAAFALAIYPGAVEGRLPIGREGVNDLGRIAQPLLSVDGEIRWQERLDKSGTRHPQLTRLSRVLARLDGARRERAQQLFNWCLVVNLVLESPGRYEIDFNGCVEAVAAEASR